ncbi:MAG: esterase-like activity of phytase family protein [Planctomycetota bacterium]
MKATTRINGITQLSSWDLRFVWRMAGGVQVVNRAVVGVLWSVCLASGLLADDSLELLGTVRIPGTARDLSGETAVLENGEAVNRTGGFSALDYTGRDRLYAALSDRGPDDGAVSYPCRVQFYEITISPGAHPAVRADLRKTVRLKDSQGRPLTGRSTLLQASETLGRRLDPEGLRLGPAGTFYISDEYGPEILAFDASGLEQRSFTLPGYFRVQRPNGDRDAENAANTAGRASNRGMECLALSADGKSLLGLMQGPLLQDGRREGKKILGRACRLLELQLGSGAVREYVYELDSEANGNSELLAVDATRLLVLERDGGSGENAAYRRLVLIDLSGATDISGIERLPEDPAGAGIRPVKKRVWLDLLDPRWNLAGAGMPEKIEGLTFGEVLADGRRTLLVGTDNDFESASDSLIWVFAFAQTPQ